MENTTNLRFFWNGIKATDGKLQRCSFDGGQLIHFPAGTISIYSKATMGFSKEIGESFTVTNNSDGTTDYFENDHIRVTPDHRLYAQVAKALALRTAHFDKRFAKAGL